MAVSVDGGGASGFTGDPMQAHVRVLGLRLKSFVEFEFSLGDGDLSVELILPILAFDEFCRSRSALVAPLDASDGALLEQTAWRARHPGLLQRLSGDESLIETVRHRPEE